MKRLRLSANEASFWNKAIIRASVKQTYLDKAEGNNIYQILVTKQEHKGHAVPSILQQICNIDYVAAAHML